MILRAVLAAALLCGLAACTADHPTRTTTSHSTITLPAPSSSYVPPPPSTVTPLPPGAHPHAGEVEKRCPYIASTRAQDPAVDVELINGSHVARTTVITTMDPPGCRFYFYRPPYQAQVDIVTKRFATPMQAYNAMVVTSRAGTQATGAPAIVPGVDAFLFRTKFFGPDGSRDWACAFAVKNVLVIVHTDRDDQQYNALALAKAIAGKF